MSKTKDPVAGKVDSLLKQIRIGNKSSVAKLEKLFRKKSANPHALFGMGCIALEYGKGKEALDYLQQAQARGFPDQAGIRRNLLIASAMCDEVDIFNQQWEAIETERPDLKSRLEPIKSAYKAARFHNHLTVLERILEVWGALAPEDRSLYLSRIAIKIDTEKEDEAKGLIKEIPEIDDDDFASLILAAELCDKVKDQKCFEFCKKAHTALDKGKANDFQRLISMARKLKNDALAEQLLQELVDLHPDLYQTKLFDLISVHQDVCNWDKMEERIPEYLNAVKLGKTFPAGIWKALSWPGLTDADHLFLADSFLTRFGDTKPIPPEVYQRKLRNGRKLRIGYMSADFKNHPVAQLLVEIIENHDGNLFETYAYDLAEESSSLYRKRILKAFDHVAHVREMPILEMIDKIREDNIDILVDLQGDTTDSRYYAFRERLAPIQVNWLGYAGTTGHGVSDYIIADKHVIPESSFEHFAEKPVWMPDTYIPNDPQREPLPVPPRIVAGLPENALVFCCFNGKYKINNQIFNTWMQILSRVPDSVLWLKQESKAIQETFARKAEANGVDASRIIFSTYTQYQTEHLTRLQCADIALDTRPYNSHTTCIDALWAGVPLITLPGNTFASRVAASILHVAGLQDLIAADIQEYTDKAVELATDASRRKSLRDYLISARGTSVLFDSVRFTRNLESAYEAMYSRFEQGLEPAPITDLEAPVSDSEGNSALPSVQLSLERAESYLKNEKVDLAMEHFSHALSQDPENAQALHGVGLIHGLYGRYPQALGHLERAVQLDPEVEHYQQNLDIMLQKSKTNHTRSIGEKLESAMTRHRQGDLNSASFLYQEILDKSPRHPQALHYSGLIQIQQGDATGLDKMLTSLQIQPHNPEFLQNYNKAKKLAENMKQKDEDIVL